MEHLPSVLQAASLGSVGAILVQPDGAHLALFGVVITTAGSIIATAINRRADRQRDALRYQHECEARNWQAEQTKAAFNAAAKQAEFNASAARTTGAAASVQAERMGSESVSRDAATMTAIHEGVVELKP